MRLLYYLMLHCIKTQSFVSKFMLSASGLSLKSFERNNPVSLTAVICWREVGMLTWTKGRGNLGSEATDSSGKAPAERSKGRRVLKGCEEGTYLVMGGVVTNPLWAGIMKQLMPREARRQMTKLKQKPSDDVSSEGLGMAWRRLICHLNLCARSACG